MKTKHLVIIVLLIVLALTSCGGHKSGSSTNNSTTGGSTKDQTQRINLPVPDPLKFTSAVSVVPNIIQITTSQKDDYLNAQFAKYGYSVAYRTGNYVTLNVPDGNLDNAAYQLRKEPAVLAVDVIHKYTTHSPSLTQPVLNLAHSKTASFYPVDPFYADFTLQPVFSDPAKYPDYTQDQLYRPGQKQMMDVMNPSQGWDVLAHPTPTGLTLTGVASTPVVLAIIDAGVYNDGSAPPNPHPDFGPVGRRVNLPVSPDSAHVFAAGNFDTADWCYDVVSPTDRRPLYNRNTGYAIMGVAAANINSPVFYQRPPATPPITPDTWAASIAGVDPFSTVLVIKTGTGSGTPGTPSAVWSFTDQEITNSIDYARTHGANIILLGMFSNVGATPVNSALQTAITAARNAGILVIAPAGQDLSVMVDPDGTPNSGDEYWNNGVNVSNISPAKATGVMSVAASGISQSNFGSAPVANQWGLPFAETIDQLTGYSNTNASIAAPGFAYGFSNNYFNPFIGTEYSAGYVAGAAAICFQALTNRNGGTPPAGVDATIFTILQQTTLYQGMTHMPGNSGVLDIGLAATIANNGGWDVIIPALDITTFSTPNMYNDGGILKILPTVGQPFSVTVNFIGGTPPYNIIVDWGDGSRTPASGTTPIISGDIINKPNPYTQPGNYRLALILGDSGAPPQQSIASIPVLASNPLGIGPITLTDSNSNPVTSPRAGPPNDYTFHANLTNVLVAPGNSVSYLWDFGDSTTSTLENPVHQWLGVGSKIVTLTVTESLRIPRTRQDTFNVT